MTERSIARRKPCEDGDEARPGARAPLCYPPLLERCIIRAPAMEFTSLPS